MVLGARSGIRRVLNGMRPIATCLNRSLGLGLQVLEKTEAQFLLKQQTRNNQFT
jgi:hypothetical protein